MVAAASAALEAQLGGAGGSVAAWQLHGAIRGCGAALCAYFHGVPVLMVCLVVCLVLYTPVLTIHPSIKTMHERERTALTTHIYAHTGGAGHRTETMTDDTHETHTKHTRNTHETHTHTHTKKNTQNTHTKHTHTRTTHETMTDDTHTHRRRHHP
jgi:hypothetical protein